MCGIAGIWTQRGLEQSHHSALSAAIKNIAHRGPDAEGSQSYAKAAFGHTRLSIIDTSARSNQPMCDPSGRYCLVFNGEIYNHRKLAMELTQSYGITLYTSGDTEVLLYGLIHEGKSFLEKINGFFAFGFYDSVSNQLLCARDRFGIKPFYYSHSEDDVAFGSTLLTVMAFRQNTEISKQSLFTYLQLSYVPEPLSMIEGIRKLPPGHWMQTGDDEFEIQAWYSTDDVHAAPSSQPNSKRFANLLGKSVESRLLADVPVGTFLSGGLDSSVISLLASRAQSDIPAFSIGFPDHPYFDESDRARAIAKHIGVRHEVFAVRENDIEDELETILNSIDEPFADSSAVLVNILSLKTRREVKVALSGDGADELLGGYNKHRALLRSLQSGLLNRALRSSAPALNLLPASRSHKAFDGLRKIKRYSRGLKLDFSARYLEWASFTPGGEVAKLLKPSFALAGIDPTVLTTLARLDPKDFNSVLRADLSLVLANDMLHKVDSMSMQRALEVRVPFLDHEVVNFVLSLPFQEKIDKNVGKKLLRKAFEKDFPPGLFEGGKRGFEAPLQHWLNTVLSSELDRFLATDFLEDQGIFDASNVQQLRRKVRGNNPGDSPHTLWAILVFQHWWNRHVKAEIRPK